MLEAVFHLQDRVRISIKVRVTVNVTIRVRVSMRTESNTRSHVVFLSVPNCVAYKTATALQKRSGGQYS